MSAFHDNALIGASGSQGYTISRSVRLRSSASAYFNRTPTSVTNNLKWTWSSWVKRGALEAQGLYDGYVSGTAFTTLSFYNNALLFYNYVSGVEKANMVTAAVFRDPSAWYHIVCVYDSANATAADRLIIYVNGVRQTLTTTTAVGSSDSNYINNTSASQRLGVRSDVPWYFDGYVTETNFIDGQALTPSSFGETNAVTGVWQAKKYSGTYGTNGFYLNFSDNSSNTSTTIGKDYSGNGNNWTPNNISVTTGSTYDSMLDVPTPYADGGNGRGNYAVLNPLGGSAISNLTISNANLTVTTPIASSSNFFKAACSIAVSTGKWYFEDTVTAVNTNNWAISISGAAPLQDSSNQNGLSTGEVTYFAYASSFETIYVNGSATFTGSAAASVGDVIGVAFDADARTIQFYRNNSAVSTAQTINSASTYFISLLVRNNTTASIHNANFGQRPFSYTPPSGFKALNTQNLPAPTISNGANYMAATTYTGNGANRSISNAVNGVSFQPDFVWVKNRTNAYDHNTYDSLRPQGSRLITNLTNAEGGTTTVQVNSFNSDGFGLGTYIGVNESGSAFVGWQWKESATAGFDIVTYTGDGTAGRNISHSLGVAPSMMIVKSRSSGTENWRVYHKNMAASPATVYMNLNDTGAYSVSSTRWNDTAPTSSVFTVGSDSSVNANGATYVSYLFAEVAGFSKFGSYTGNGSSDGPFVFTNFRPRWIMIKRTDVANDWFIIDTSRNTYNVAGTALYPNSSSSETTNGFYDLDVLSNGFKVKATNAVTNASGGTYVYAAFAENPYKLALAR